MTLYEAFLESVPAEKSVQLFGPQGFVIRFNQHT